MGDVFTVARSTTSVEEAQLSMSELYGPMRLTADPPREFRYAGAMTGDADFSLGRLRYTGACRAGTDGFPDLVLAYAVRGQHRWALGRETGVGTIPFVGSYGYGAPSLGPVIVILTWLALGFALVVAGAIGPVVSLRRSALPASSLRLPAIAALGVTVMAALLAAGTIAQAVVLSDRTDLYNAVMMWGAVALMTGAAVTSSTSVGRALRAR